jgi:S-DNA-T family DNA segregation ATPase FtsK/SpoIIIE
MAKKKEENSGTSKRKTLLNDLKDETIQGVVAIIFFVLGILFILAAFGKSGLVGAKVYSLSHYLLGFGYFLLPLLFFILGGLFWRSLERSFPLTKVIGSLIFFLSGLGIINVAVPKQGGVVGNLISSPLIKLFDVYTTLVILSALFIIALFIIFDAKLTFDPLLEFWDKTVRKQKGAEPKVRMNENEYEEDDEEEPTSEPEEATKEEKPAPVEKKSKLKAIIGGAKEEEEDFAVDNRTMAMRFKGLSKEWTPPPLSLLERDKGKPVVGDIKANANIIKRTLQNFGIIVEMDEISIGPSVTRYALKPAEGVKLSRIVALQNDMALALAAHPIRIEAPIPGKSLVGIEIPNSTKSTVGLATLLASEDYQKSEKPLLVSLGKGISGKSHFSNLAKMPHLLIAGTTGSGKSVTIHAIITSLLFRNPPTNLKFIMVDPKRVELTLYNKIPHLLTPVITDAKKAILALKWAAKEMDRRYDILESASVRDIESYHKNILAPALEKFAKEEKEGEVDETKKVPEIMPYIVCVIDELADIMQTYPRELESAIVRLAQMSRAVGIHLIVSTQRPSVNVITGLIKANIPSRLALQVSAQIDSRTILDTGGAEKLLGAGDMLFLGGEMSKPERIQSAYISENEVKKVVKYFIETFKDEVPDTGLNLTPEGVADKNAIFESSFDTLSEDVDDDLYEQAKEEVIHAGKASTSYIQRKLRVGYARAARLMDILEEKGIIGPADGAKPREIIGIGAGNGEPSEEQAVSEENPQ